MYFRFSLELISILMFIIITIVILLLLFINYVIIGLFGLCVRYESVKLFFFLIEVLIGVDVKIGKFEIIYFGMDC